MSIVLARIDDRLIHGQVTESWCKLLKPEKVLIVSDEVASSQFQKDLMLAALPACFSGSITTVRNAPSMINEMELNPDDAMILFESPKDVLAVMENGARLKEVNVGGMHSTRNKREVLNYIYLDDEDIACLKALRNLGVKLDFRDVPEHENVDIMSKL